MKANFDKCLAEVLKREGGFVNDPRDAGGMTNLGVTKAVYEAWVGYKVSEKIMRSLTPSHVKALYKQRYWDAAKCDLIPSGLDMCIFDFAVNAGVSRAIKTLQGVLGIMQDGIIGPNTIAVMDRFTKAHSASELVDIYQNDRISFYKGLDKFNVFGKGWINRVEAVRLAAKGLTL